MTERPGVVAALAAPEANLGLRQGVVQISEHDPRWAGLYADVAPALIGAVSDLGASVEHIGSTSVPGLAAKPILDIAIGAPAPINNDVYIARLEALGCTFQADLGIYGGLLFSITIDGDRVVSHLHVVDIADFQWRWYLAFRDALRSDSDLRGEYQMLKHESATEHAADRERYTQAKFDWILKTVQAVDPESN